MSKTLSLRLSNKSAKPVWCGSEGVLKIVFLKVQLIDKKFLLSGFGRKPKMVEIYKIPEFMMKTEDESLIFQNLYMASSFGGTLVVI